MRQKLQLTILMVMTVALPGVTEASPERKRLFHDLLANYDTNVIPNKDTEPIVVKLTTFSMQRVDVDEVDQEFVLNAWAGFEWTDADLKWDSEKYGNITAIRMNPKEVWLPDLTFYNTMAPEELEILGSTRLVVSSEGKVLQVSPFRVGFSCEMDLTYWPNDRHTCSIKIGSWTYSAYEIDLRTIDNPFDTQFVYAGMEWQIVSSDVVRNEVIYECCPEPYIDLTVTLNVARQTPFYTWTIKTPALCLTFLTLILFTLPPAAAAKLTFGGLCLLLNLVLLIFTASKINHSPYGTPLIVQLIVAQMVMTAVSVMVSAWVVRVSTGPFLKSPPSSLHSLASFLAPALCLSSYQSESGKYVSDKERMKEEEEEEEERQRTNNSKHHQWSLLAAISDRIALFIHLIITLILVVRFFLFHQY